MINELNASILPQVLIIHVISTDTPGPDDRKIRVSRFDGSETIYSRLSDFQATLKIQDEESDELCKNMKPFESL